MPAAVALTFGTMLLTVGYMERVLNKKIKLDIRIAKVKARLNAESGASITISGSTDDGFVASLGSSDWPPFSSDDQDEYDIGIVDSETFPSSYEPEKITSFFPNAGIANSPDIDMGEFYNIRLEAKTSEVTRRPERSGVAYGRAKVKNIFGNDVYMIDSAQVKFTVEVLSDFMYLTHHEFAGGAPSIFGPPTGFNPSYRRQPCFGQDDALGAGDQSLVGFTQTLDAMQFCTTGGTPVFDNLVYVTESTCTSETDPPCWEDATVPGTGQSYNWTNVPEGSPIFPNGYYAGNINSVFTSTDASHEDCYSPVCGWEKKDPVCFPLSGYKETVLGARAPHIYDSTEKLRFSNQSNLGSTYKDTLIMTDIEFLSQGGYRVKRWWYLTPPYLRGDMEQTVTNPTDFSFPKPYHLEGMPPITYTNGAPTPTPAEITQMRNLCEGAANIDNQGLGDLTKCDPYEEALHDFSSLLIDSHPLGSGGIYYPATYNESFNTNYNSDNVHNGGPGGGVTRLSHFDIENFTNSPQKTGITTGPNEHFGYFQNKGWFPAAKDWDLSLPQELGGNLIQDEVIPYEDSEVIIYVKGGPVRVRGTFKGAYTVVTSGWDAVGDNNCLEDGCAGYDGYSTYRRHAWFNNVPAFGGTAPSDTLRANIWIVGDLENVDVGIGDCGGDAWCPPQPCPFDENGDPVCDLLEPGDCGGSENIMGLVSAANVVIANSPENRSGGIDIHASIAALNESFVMHYWQHGSEGCAGVPPFTLNLINQNCNQNPPQADNRGWQIYRQENLRGDIRLCGGIIQSYRGYMKRGPGGGSQYDPSTDIGMDKQYRFDNNLYFPPPGAITVNECESSTVRMSMIDYGRPE